MPVTRTMTFVTKFYSSMQGVRAFSPHMGLVSGVC